MIAVSLNLLLEGWPFKLSDKAISALWKRLNDARLFCAIPECLAQPVNGFVQTGFKVNEGIVRL